MARERRRFGSTALRETMAARAEERVAFWAEHFGSADCAFAVKSAELAEWWRSGDPMELHAWELPDSALGGIHPGTRVVVTADGTVEIAQPHAPAMTIVGGRLLSVELAYPGAP